MMNAAFTSFTYATLPQARTLAATFRKAHPGWALHAVAMDLPPPGLDAGAASRDFDRVVAAGQLAIPDLRAWLFMRDEAEACAAVAGAMLVDMLATGFDQVSFLDCRMAVLQGLPELDEGVSVVLAPRVMTPGGDEAATLRDGLYRPGALTVRNDGAGRSFAAWWADRLGRPDGGVQWLDLAPALFDGVQVRRDPGAAATVRQLAAQALAFQDGSLTVDGAALRCCDFAAPAPAGPIELFELQCWYARQLDAHAVAGITAGSWAYASFSNGVAIPNAVRRAYRSRPDLAAQYPDPFGAADALLALAAD